MLQMRSLVFSVVSFCGAFCLTALAVHACVGDPLLLHADMRSEKLALMAEWREQATAAAFGSSHVHNGFDPRAFDRELTRAAMPETTLNLAVEGGSQTEQRAMALRFVRQLTPHAGPPPLVLLELNAGANPTNDHLVHPRSINLYDWQAVQFARSLTAASQPLSQRVGRPAYALAAFALHMTNFGMVSSRIFPAPLSQSEMTEEAANDRRGLLSPELPTGQARRMQQIISRNVTESSHPLPAAVLPGNRALAEELQRASSVDGLQVVYWTTPKLSDMQSMTVWPPCIKTDGGAVPIFMLNRPDLYPQLFHSAENWTDDAHLTEAGAATAGRLLALRWTEWVAERHNGTAPACVS